MTHINGINRLFQIQIQDKTDDDLPCSPNSIALFAKMVEGLGVPVEIATTEAHVPSFMVSVIVLVEMEEIMSFNHFQEKWVFYQLTRKEGEVKEMDGAEAKVNGVESHEKKKEEEEEKAEEAKEAASEDKEGDKSETGKEEKKEDKKEESKKEEKKKVEKKEEKKTGGAKGSKEALESPKEKGLTKEKSNVDKKGAPKKTK